MIRSEFEYKLTISWCALLLVVLLEVPSARALYSTDYVGHVQLNEDMSSYVDIYYPIDVGHVVPAVIVLSDEGVNKESYSDIAIQVAARGFIVACTQYQKISEIGEDIIGPAISLIPDTLVYLSDSNLRPESPLYDIVDLNRVGILGHGLGGLLGIMLAAANGSSACVQEGYCKAERYFPAVPELACVVTYGSDLFSRRSGSLVGLEVDAVTINFFHGDFDGISTVDSGKKSYESIAGPKSRWICDKQNHHAITNDPATEDPLFEDIDVAKSNEEVIKVLGKNFSFLFSAWLKNDESVKEKYFVKKILPSGSPSWLHLVDVFIDTN